MDTPQFFYCMMFYYTDHKKSYTRTHIIISYIPSYYLHVPEELRSVWDQYVYFQRCRCPLSRRLLQSSPPQGPNFLATVITTSDITNLLVLVLFIEYERP